MKDLLLLLLGALALSLLAQWVAHNKPRSADLAWRLLDRATRLTLPREDEAWEPPPPPRSEPFSQPFLRKKRLTQLMKKRVAARDQWRCQICGQLVSANFEIDHIVPQSRGGGHEDSNLRTLCRECHGEVTAVQRLK